MAVMGRAWNSHNHPSPSKPNSMFCGPPKSRSVFLGHRHQSDQLPAAERAVVPGGVASHHPGVPAELVAHALCAAADELVGAAAHRAHQKPVGAAFDGVGSEHQTSDSQVEHRLYQHCHAVTRQLLFRCCSADGRSGLIRCAEASTARMAESKSSQPRTSSTGSKSPAIEDCSESS
jgi:hypothetical protein